MEALGPSPAVAKPLVYLAGPYTLPDPVENIHNAVKLADRLLDVCVPVIPHLSGTWHMISPKPYETWLELDLAVMARCDIVFRFGGASSGADAEVVAAQAAGQPVVYTETQLREWILSEQTKVG
jgi:nucleoside 2-deoxyribosyltransferase